MARSSTQPIDFSRPLDSIDRSSLSGQSILITGGASGIGYAFVEACAAAGAYVTSVDVNKEAGENLIQALVSKGLKVQFIHCDVRSWDEQVAAFEAAVSFSPDKSLDIVMPVAGLGARNIRHWFDEPFGADGKLAKPNMDILDVNFTAVHYSTHLALHHFRRTLGNSSAKCKSKQLVFVSSLAGYAGLPRMATYSGAKFGVRGIWKTLRDEREILDPSGVVPFRSSLLAPFFVKTNMTLHAVDYLASLNYPMATTDDCVDAMVRIVCDESVDGRAVAVAPNGQNFDLLDDLDGGNGGPEFRRKLEAGAFGLTLEQINAFFRDGL